MKDQLLSRYLTYFLFLQILVVQYTSRKPEFIEKYYSNGIYPYIAASYRSSLGWIPFSVGDFFYAFFGFLILRFFYIVIRDKFSEIRRYLLAIGATFSILYFLFQLSWGMNYYRVPLATQLHIESTSYSDEQLNKFTGKLVKELNALHLKTTQDSEQKITVPYTRKEIYKLAVNGYTHISKQHAFLNYKFPSVKHSLLSTPLTYMGFAGYLNPLTGEAQVNSKMPLPTYAFTTCHEMAHQLGFAAENEANFIGYLAAIHNEDVYFQIAGKMTALKYVLSELRKRDLELYKLHYENINKGILINFRESNEFWNSYENPFEPLFKKSYSTYLKANRQKGGIKSYSYMVNLLLNYKDTQDL
ncbi:DUF3810 domain-containing protein [Flavicella sediminum]|uniref:DUF3810 domain-containing protein n=1 Tax=Flavicella sediminum TaxID=2585141 RepID=UPI0011234DED|nr:DUF3810 domain-containing protein [Flavicella sediminum]